MFIFPSEVGYGEECAPPKKILGVLPIEMVSLVHFRINLGFHVEG